MSNFGKMHNLRVGGLPLGEVLEERFRRFPRRTATYGSIIAVVATDAPLLPNQIKRLCRRVALGIGRVGSYAAHGSGEIVVGFSTANIIPRRTQKMVTKVKFLLDQRLDPLYEAVMEATEEAILNSMCMAGPMTGINGNHCPALPLDEVRRFVEAVRPALGQPAAGTGRRPGLRTDGDREGTVTVAEALPTAVRGAEGIPFPTRPPGRAPTRDGPPRLPLLEAAPPDAEEEQGWPAAGASIGASR